MTSEQRAILERERADYALTSDPDSPDHTIAAALTAALGTCGNCAHSNDDQSLLSSLNTYCTRRFGFYHGKLMEKSARCEKWEAQA